MNTDPLSAAVARLAALDDETRRALYEYVSGAETPVGRDQAAHALALPRSTAAFHLDRLVGAGLLRVSYQRLTGRSGPGAGRPAKLYEAGAREVSASVPPRRYDLAAHVLADAVSECARTGAPVRETLLRVAARRGQALAEGSDSLEDVLV
ncbi:MAG: helix-turn-helix domain-containing protein, partial [Sciscionella sp.]